MKWFLSGRGDVYCDAFGLRLVTRPSPEKRSWGVALFDEEGAKVAGWRYGYTTPAAARKAAVRVGMKIGENRAL